LHLGTLGRRGRKALEKRPGFSQGLGTPPGPPESPRKVEARLVKIRIGRERFLEPRDGPVDPTALEIDDPEIRDDHGIPLLDLSRARQRLFGVVQTAGGHLAARQSQKGIGRRERSGRHLKMWRRLVTAFPRSQFEPQPKVCLGIPGILREYALERRDERVAGELAGSHASNGRRELAAVLGIRSRRDPCTRTGRIAERTETGQ
jgi:hypothetical protein